MEAGASLQFHFWPKIHEQATKCEQARYRGAKATNCFATNPAVFFGPRNGVELVGSAPCIRRRIDISFIGYWRNDDVSPTPNELN